MKSQHDQPLEFERIPAPLRKTHDVLLNEGREWRKHLPFSSSLAAQIVRQTSQKAQQEKTKLVIPPRSHPRQPVFFFSQKGILVSVLGILLVVGVVGFFGDRHSSVTKSVAAPSVSVPAPPAGVPPPPLFSWTRLQDGQNLTPQEAFAQGVTLTPCKGVAPERAKISWVGTSADFGLAIIRVQCREDASVLLFSMMKDTQHSWVPLVLGGAGRSAALPARDAFPVPQWLHLPAANYGGIYTTGAGTPSILLRGWNTTAQLFVGGTVSLLLTYPSHGTPITIGDHPGIVAQDQELVILLATLAPKKIFLFVSTADVANTQQLALAMLNHLNELDSL